MIEANPPLSSYCLPKMKSHSTALNSSKTLVLRVIKDSKVISRKTLADYTGLTQASITNITHDLLESGLIIENGLVEGSHGRRMVGLSIVPDRFFSIGLRITPQYFAVGIFDINSDCIEIQKVYWDTFLNVHRTLDELSRYVQQYIDYGTSKGLEPIAISMSLLGHFFLTSTECIIMEKQGNSLDLAEFLFKAFRLPVYYDSAANFGLYYISCSRAYNYLYNETVVHLNISYDVDLSIIENRSILRGNVCIPGSYGSTMVTDRDGTRLALWDAVSTSNILLKAKRLAQLHPDSLINRYDSEHLSFRNLLETFYEGDTVAAELFEYMADVIGSVLAQLIITLHPHRIFVGDEIPSNESFHHMVIEATRSHLPFSQSNHYFPQIERLYLARETKNDYTILGASKFATNKVLQSIDWLEKFSPR